jgi:hypothetical protein
MACETKVVVTAHEAMVKIMQRLINAGTLITQQVGNELTFDAEGNEVIGDPVFRSELQFHDTRGWIWIPSRTVIGIAVQTQTLTKYDVCTSISNFTRDMLYHGRSNVVENDDSCLMVHDLTYKKSTSLGMKYDAVDQAWAAIVDAIQEFERGR